MMLTTRLLAAGVAGAVLAGTLATPSAAAPGVTAQAARTSAVEQRRVDSVPTPDLRWYACYGYAQCATVRLPLDYDDPYGASTEVALLRVKARNPRAKIGSLFVNPGGPGVSATRMALAAPMFLSDAVLERFDVVGVDPRGTGSSQRLKCFPSTRSQTVAMTGMNVAFPMGRRQEAAYLKAVTAVGEGCATTGRQLAGAMSTAEVARDLDVLRRAVGDRKLSFLGFSYGSALGQYYANMFPDRVRVIAVDGVVNPVAWVGYRKTRGQVQDERMHSADGAYRALREILTRCDAAGVAKCTFAAGNPVRNFDAIARRLRAHPLVLGDTPVGTVKITYADFVGVVLNALYSPYAGELVTLIASAVAMMLSPSAAPAGQAAAKATLVKRFALARRTAPGHDFPYHNGAETFSGVMCTDGLHPADAARWPALAARADRRAPYFGRAWAWASAQCARDSWTVRDEDAFRGPFTRRTSSPVLVVGNYWDPATNYDQAVVASRLLPNSRLLTSNNWGHTAYGSSPCVTNAVDAYLLRRALPARGKVCNGSRQPFTEPLGGPEMLAAREAAAVATASEVTGPGLPTAGQPKQLPPVAGRVPTSMPVAGAR